MNKTQLDAIYQRAEEYYYGKNGKKSDTAKALELYRQAAEQGHAEALYELVAVFVGDYHSMLFKEVDVPIGGIVYDIGSHLQVCRRESLD